MNLWVISGCSHGLGRCWTRSVIEDRGERVIGITRSREAASELEARFGDHFVGCVADVRDAAGLAQRLTTIADHIGAPNRIVTAAGYAQFGTLENLTVEEIREQFATNVEGTLNVIRPLLPFLRRRDAARILLVSSMSGVACWPLLGAYQISKHAVEAISDTLRHELDGTGIGVGCIEPGPHKTGWATVYARRGAIGAGYDAQALKERASCGYPIAEPEASLPYFWAMFDAPVMPRRIATSRDFVEHAVAEARTRIEDWRASHAG